MQLTEIMIPEIRRRIYYVNQFDIKVTYLKRYILQTVFGGLSRDISEYFIIDTDSMEVISDETIIGLDGSNVGSQLLLIRKE